MDDAPATAAQNSCFLNLFPSFFVAVEFQQREQTFEDLHRRRGAAFDVEIDGDDVADAADDRIASGEAAAV